MNIEQPNILQNIENWTLNNQLGKTRWLLSDEHSDCATEHLDEHLAEHFAKHLGEHLAEHLGEHWTIQPKISPNIENSTLKVEIHWLLSDEHSDCATEHLDEHLGKHWTTKHWKLNIEQLVKLGGCLLMNTQIVQPNI